MNKHPLGILAYIYILGKEIYLLYFYADLILVENNNNNSINVNKQSLISLLPSGYNFQ